MKERIILFVVLVIIATMFFSCSKQKQDNKDVQTEFVNPVIKGDMADPTIIRVGDTYYAAGTSSEWAPHYPMFSSKDLVNWTQVGHVFENKPEWTSSSFWAPELFYHNNKVYCYYSARRASDGISCIGVATADSPDGVFTDHGVVVDYGPESIDAFVYDDNGQLYISWKAYGLDPSRPIEIVGSKLSADGMSLEGEIFTMLVDEENIGMEGQYHFKEGDYYYIVYANRGCCGPGSDYEVAVARSRSFEGPYEKYEGNPILIGGNDYQSCGHGTAVTSPDGRMYYMCHAYLKDEDFFQGRQAIVQEMILDENAWPCFLTGKEALRKQIMPFDDMVQDPMPAFDDDFNIKKLRNEWTWNYTVSDMHYEIKDGNLYLSGEPKGNNHYGTVLCLRPTSAKYSYETQVVGENTSIKGLTIYGDDRSLIYLASIDDKIVLKTVNDGNESTLFETDFDKESVNLKIEVSKGRDYLFFWSQDGESWMQINEEPLDGGSLIRWDRVARPGLIHIGEQDQPAVFSSFKYRNID